MYPWHIKGHQVYSGVLIIQYLLSVAVGFATGTLVSGLLIGLVILALPLFLFKTAPSATITRHVAVVASQLFAALHIQQAGGLTYMHFEIFAVMAVTTVYRDWRVVVSSVLVVAVHHVLFYVLQTSGSGVFIFEESNLMIYVLAIHAAFAVAEGAVLYFISKQSEQEALSSLEILNAISHIMAEPGKLDLSASPQGDTREIREFRALLAEFSSLVKNAINASSNISEVSKTVCDLSNEVGEASMTTTGQVSTIAAATEEMTVNNDAVAERAKSVNTLSDESRTSSLEASEVVIRSNEEVLELQQNLGATATTIMSLSEKCQQIETVMASITSISEQTNLLALNAAIESARAGEHGRGFAVVADEVRQLAMRTKENTQQISDITSSLIMESKASVDSMNGCVEKSKSVAESSNSAKHIIDSVVSNIAELSENMTSVSVAISEQSLASSEIAKSTNALASTSSTLSNNAENSGKTVTALNREISSLQQELAKFK
ncbi:methyl-accepting chemotaxis protein [Glaciecola sp. MH2013]|uniref:methyl-accepting chemotaxis protein n=1 Tax=Glaciecola sp. MH2013 TaxID=2785524 RepID=UPI00189DC7A2|nr:methyl-accepting chemotaxis protein [Glaciecola sp. MH2013]MBF7074221.1 methyl-accepting chemotaxis protein [Glaciecola sp. MH2013]